MGRHYATPHIRRHASPQASYTFQQIAQRMNFPLGTYTGKGITVGVMSLGGALPLAKLASFLGFAPRVNVIALPGADMTPDPQGADVENCLDAIGILSIAPDATVNFYAAPNSAQGMLAVVQRAVSDGVPLSQSWGSPEDQAGNITAMEAAYASGHAKGLLFTAAAGDNGADDSEGRPVADYPASSAYNLGCGGTTIASPVDTVWNDGTQGGATGGGPSKLIKAPAWQLPFLPGGSTWRGVPDVAANADPQTGYQSIDGDGNPIVVGGTSAVAPLMMGLWALGLEAAGGVPPADPLALVYGLAAPAFVDITVGNNAGFSAGVGFDYCTGRGEAIGSAWLAALLGTVPPSPPPPGPPSPPPPAVGPTESAVQGPVDAVFAAWKKQHRILAPIVGQLQHEVDAAIAGVPGWPS